MADQVKIDEIIGLLKTLQEFDPVSLDRAADLGKQLCFTEIVDSAREIINLYKKLTFDTVRELSGTHLDEIKRQIDSDTGLFNQIMTFEATRSDAANARATIINQVKNRRDPLFQALLPFITYGFTKITDVSLLEEQVRTTIEKIQSDTSELTTSIQKNKTAAETALAAIRGVAAENGVSQQANYFKEEADSEEGQADGWFTILKNTSIAIAVYVVLNLFLHKCTWLAPTNEIETIQFVTAKALIFIFLAYILFLSAKNYSAHKHNAVVNRHRQNALLTYKTLVEAGSEKVTQDIVLAHAASCIFSPQETAFSSSKGEFSGGKSVLELMTKSTKTSD